MQLIRQTLDQRSAGPTVADAPTMQPVHSTFRLNYRPTDHGKPCSYMARVFCVTQLAIPGLHHRWTRRRRCERNPIRALVTAYPQKMVLRTYIARCLRYKCATRGLWGAISNRGEDISRSSRRRSHCPQTPTLQPVQLGLRICM